MRIVWIVLLLFVPLSPPMASEEGAGGRVPPLRPRTFAIVLGVNASDNDRTPTLKYADDDAVATHRLLLDAGVKSFLLTRVDAKSRRLYAGVDVYGPPDRAHLLASFAEIQGQISKAKARGYGTEFLFFYSGHGDVDHGEGYVVLESARLTRTMLYEEILEPSAAAQNHVIIDACKSFFLAFGKGPGGEHTPYSDQFMQGALPNTGFVLSTSSAQDSHEWERFQSGIFSHEVRSALRGSADLDVDGRITYRELGAFLKIANDRVENPRFRPDFVIRPPQALSPAVLQWGKGDSFAFELDAPDLGHVYVESKKGERLLDVHPRAGERVVLRLPVSRPLFVRAHKEDFEYVIAAKNDRRVSQLVARAPGVTRKGALHLAFEVLFEAPFGTADLENYDAGAKRVPFDLGLRTHVPLVSTLKVQEVAKWTALGAGTLGVTATLVGVVSRNAGSGASHAKRTSLNQRIGILNTAAWVLYGVAGAAGLTWLGYTLQPDTNQAQFRSTASADGFGVEVSVPLD